MQMWMVWMIWIVFIQVIFGLLADALSECKGYARSWFYIGLLLGPVAILILLTRPDPEGQVEYIDVRNPVEQGPMLMRDPRTGAMIPSMVSNSDRKITYRNGYKRNVTKIMQIGAELAGIAILLRILTLILSIFTSEVEGEAMHLVFSFSALIILFIAGLKCVESNKALALGMIPLLLVLVSHMIDLGHMAERGGKYTGFSYAWECYGGYIVTEGLCLIAFFIMLMQSQKALPKQVHLRGYVILGALSIIMCVIRLIQGADEIKEYTEMQYARTGLTITIQIASTLISCCFFLSYFCFALREGMAEREEEKNEETPQQPTEPTPSPQAPQFSQPPTSSNNPFEP